MHRTIRRVSDCISCVHVDGFLIERKSLAKCLTRPNENNNINDNSKMLSMLSTWANVRAYFCLYVCKYAISRNYRRVPCIHFRINLNLPLSVLTQNAEYVSFVTNYHRERLEMIWNHLAKVIALICRCCFIFFNTFRPLFLCSIKSKRSWAIKFQYISHSHNSKHTHARNK